MRCKHDSSLLPLQSLCMHFTVDLCLFCGCMFWTIGLLPLHYSTVLVKLLNSTGNSIGWLGKLHLLSAFLHLPLRLCREAKTPSQACCKHSSLQSGSLTRTGFTRFFFHHESSCLFFFFCFLFPWSYALNFSHQFCPGGSGQKYRSRN